MSRQPLSQNRQPARIVTQASSGVLQRQCGCGKRTQGVGGCSSCRNKRLLQRRANREVAVGTVPPVVHDVLRTPGQPLDAATRGYMEPRFGHDFSRVRVHTDARAAASAHAVNALAYTVGEHVVFGAGQFAPTTFAGRRLLAHELTHVIQQGHGGHPLGGHVPIAPANDRAEQEADAIAHQIVLGDKSGVIGAFLPQPHLQKAGEQDALKNFVGTWFNRDDKAKKQQSFTFTASGGQVTGTYSNPDPDAIFKSGKIGPLSPWAGTPGWYLADYEFPTPPGSPVPVLTGKAQAQFTTPGPSVGDTFDCVVPPITGSHMVTFIKRAVVTPPTPAPPAKPKCGPDVTYRVRAACGDTIKAFTRWDHDSKMRACYQLINPFKGSGAWDILDIGGGGTNPSIALNGSCLPPHNCRMTGTGCEFSANVDGQCYYQGSANYVIWGVMCRLCHDYSLKVEGILGTQDPDNPTSSKFDERHMLFFINLHKGKIPFLRAESPNLETSKGWARAGYHGWHLGLRGAAAPFGDRPQCDTTCKWHVPFRFGVMWQPMPVIAG